MYGATSPPYGQAPYRGAPVAGPVRSPYAGGGTMSPQMQYAQQQQQQQQQRFVAAQQQQQQQQMARGYRPSIPTPGHPPQFAQPAQGQQQYRGGGGRPHKGTIPPGQMVRVGQNTVRVEKYLSEGGYAHVYLTSSDKPVYPPKRNASAKGRWGEKGYTEHCLKRIAFDDDKVWADVSKEIEVMKMLPPSPHLIQYLDSSHHRLPNGTYEVFILMEFCSGGGIIDLLNKRLRDRLKEIEILNIFTDVCEAVAAMHAMNRPLLHRDLKIENVLSHPNGHPPTAQRPTPLVFKLCDFGSTTFPASHPPQNKAEADALAMDLNKHTTLQYRSPEMVEPMLGWAVGLPSDVWALGVLLYKLCYYTTPFEEHGTLAIVNAKYTFPQYPVYSPRLQHLIASMLVEHPARRPTVFEVLRAAHDMSGTRPEVDYVSVTNAMGANPQPMPSNRLPPTMVTSPLREKPPQAGNLLDFTSGATSPKTQAPEPSLASTVQPQRRGRPTRPESMKTQQQGSPQQHHPPQRASFPHPVPAATTGPTPKPALQVTGEKPPAQGAKLQHSVSLSRRSVSGTKPPKPVLSRLQGSAFEPPGRQTSPGGVDAFGATKNGRAHLTASPGGFGDSFGGPRLSGPQDLPPPVPPKSGSGDTAFPVPRATGSTDSFGLPKSAGPGDGFGAPKSTGSGDAFGMPKGKSPVGFGDSFTGGFSSAGTGPVRLPPPTVPRSVSGFSDNFALKSTSAKSKSKPPSPTSPKKEARAPSPQRSGSQRSSAIEMGKDAEASPAVPESEMTFEQRFPSVEVLSGGEESPTPPEETQSPPPTIAARKQSLAIANLTGGDMRKADRLSVGSGQPPHPRSTHVTGTAFKTELKPPAPPPSGSPSPTHDYLSMLDDEVEKEPLAFEDHFGGDDESLQVRLAPLRPMSSNTPQSGARFGVTPAPAPAPAKPATIPQSTPNKPMGAAERATLPPMSAQRPATNFNSAQWSPLDAMKAADKPAEPKSPSPRGSEDADSSDEEAVPESAEGTGRRPLSPQRSRSPVKPSSPTRTGSHPPSPGIAARMAAYQHQATTGDSHKSGRGGRTTHSPRPQSMFVSGSNPGSPGLSPGLSTVRSRSPGIAQASSPEVHNRRNSINDIVSRYEALNTKGGGSGGDGATNGTTAHRGSISRAPPAVAAKPPSLAGPRKPSGPRLQRMPPATQPKPASLKDGSGAGAGAAGAPEKAARPKPEIAPKPTKPVLAPQPSNPELTTQPAVDVPKRSETLPVPLEPERKNGSSSQSSSPEKQQPVNLLIARWNQGKLKQ